MNDITCTYRGPELEQLPTEVSDVVTNAMGQLPASASIVVSEKRRTESGIDPDYRVDFEDFKIIYVGNRADTDVAKALVFDGEHQYEINVEGELLPGARREALGYDQSTLWTVAIPGDRFMDVLKGRLACWIEALPKEGTRYGTRGRVRQKPLML